MANIYYKRKGDHFRYIYRRKYFFSHIAFFIINAVLFITAVSLSPSNVITKYPRWIYYAYSA